MEKIEAKQQNLANFKVGSLPTLFYIPNFITETDQTLLLNNVLI
jgi:alkylated DNA repair protein alkB family protein 6